MSSDFATRWESLRDDERRELAEMRVRHAAGVERLSSRCITAALGLRADREPSAKMQALGHLVKAKMASGEFAAAWEARNAANKVALEERLRAEDAVLESSAAVENVQHLLAQQEDELDELRRRQRARRTRLEREEKKATEDQNRRWRERAGAGATVDRAFAASASTRHCHSPPETATPRDEDRGGAPAWAETPATPHFATPGETRVPTETRLPMKPPPPPPPSPSPSRSRALDAFLRASGRDAAETAAAPASSPGGAAGAMAAGLISRVGDARAASSRPPSERAALERAPAAAPVVASASPPPPTTTTRPSPSPYAFGSRPSWTRAPRAPVYEPPEARARPVPVVEPDRNPRPLQTRPENVPPLNLSLALTREETRAKTFARAKTPETRAAAVHAYGDGVTRGFSASDGRQRGAELTSPWGSKTAWTSGQVFIRGDASENQKSRGGDDDAGSGWSDDDSSTTTVDEGDDAVWGKSKGAFRSRVLEKGGRVGGVDMRRVGAASEDGGDGDGGDGGDASEEAEEGGARGRRPTGSFAAQRRAPRRGVHLPSAVELNTPLKVQT